MGEVAVMCGGREGSMNPAERRARKLVYNALGAARRGCWEEPPQVCAEYLRILRSCDDERRDAYNRDYASCIEGASKDRPYPLGEVDDCLRGALGPREELVVWSTPWVVCFRFMWERGTAEKRVIREEFREQVRDKDSLRALVVNTLLVPERLRATAVARKGTANG